MNANTQFKTDVKLPVKRVTGETMEEKMTDNAYYNILPARYLNKNENGTVIESPEEVFNRVGRNIALAEVVHEANKNDTEVFVSPSQVKPDHPHREEIIEDVFGDGVSEDEDVEVELTEYNVRYFSYDTVVPEIDSELSEFVKQKAEQFTELMENLSFMPNSPTIMNAGDELQQLSACFVRSPDDDIADIHETGKEAALTFQSGGGLGYSFSKLRPYGDTVGSTGGIASGPITFMRTYDRLCETIAQGGTRRGAQMGIMRVSHPDVVQFIHAKNKDVSLAHTLRLNDPDDFTHNNFMDALEEARELIDENGRVPKHLRNAVEGHLSNFNISVAITDDFMKAVKNDEDYTFINPRTEKPHIVTKETKELYDQFGLGEYVTVGEELSVPAVEIWDRITEGAHENGEPGIVFIDRINNKHAFPVESTPSCSSSKYEILATNPCGEQPLKEYGSCNLGHINLSTVVNENAEVQDFRQFNSKIHDSNMAYVVDEFLEQAIDWDELNRRIELGTRFLDNVVTMSDFPVEDFQRVAQNNRKIGLGIMGLAQMYIQLGVKYGSDVANEIARQVMVHINHKSKDVSHTLAVDEQRGSFSNWDDSKYANPTEYKDWFEKHTGESPYNWEDGYPLRNYNTTTIAPTGTTGMLANTTGGCEPIYNVAYYKNVSEDVQGDEMLVEFDDYFLRTLETNGIDVESVKEEALEQMSNNEFDGINGLETVPNEIGELFVTTSDLTAKEHGAVQVACQHGVDSAISKTVNAPNNSTHEDAKDVFEYIYDNGGKGVTYYRDGTRSKQVITTRAQNSEFSDMDDDEVVDNIITEIKERFGSFEEFIAHESVEGEFDGQLAMEIAAESVDGEYGGVEDIINLNDDGYATVRDRPDVLYGVTQRIDTGYGKMYVNINVDDDDRPFELFAQIGNSGGFTNSFTESLAKVISSGLRAGVDPYEIADGLVGTRSPKVAWDKGEQINSIPDAMGTALRRFLEDEIEYSPPKSVDLSETTESEQASVSEGEESETKSNETLLIQNGENPECPSCNSMTLVYKEGCKSCESCGWSEC